MGTKNSQLPHRYTIAVSDVYVVPLVPSGARPKLVLQFDGKLSARAKRQINEAIKNGNVEVSENIKVVA